MQREGGGGRRQKISEEASSEMKGWPANMLVYRFFVLFNTCFCAHCVYEGCRRMIDPQGGIRWGPLGLAISTVTPCFCFAHNFFFMRSAPRISRNLAARLLLLDMVGVSLRDIFTRMFYTNTFHLPDNAGFMAAVTNYGPVRALLLYHVWTFPVFELPHSIITRYPLRPALVCIFYMTIANIICDNITYYLVFQSFAWSYLICVVLLNVMSCFIITWVALSYLSRDRVIEGPDLPDWMLMPVVRWTHFVRRSTHSARRLSIDMMPVITMSIIGMSWPFAKFIVGWGSLSRATFDAVYIGIFVFCVLFLVPLQSQQCPLCSSTRT